MSLPCAVGAARLVCTRWLLAIALFFGFAVGLRAQRLMENLGRGVVAVRASETDVFVSWRLLGQEPQNLPFNLYRSTNGGTAVKLNAAPLTAGTNFTDTSGDPASALSYYVRPVIDGVELPPSASYTLPANAPVRPYLSLPLQATPWATYVHLVWVGDLDGDGEYDFVVSRMPSEPGRPPFIDAYKRDGSFLWRVDFGPNAIDPSNIEPPAAAINAGHNDGVTVYDLDSDGRAEVIIKSAHGVVFGDGQTLTFGDNVSQFISVLDGLTGAERARAPVPTDYIADGPVAGHFGIAYLDGVRPSFVFKAKNRIGGGAFNLMVTTWDFDGTNLVQRWKFAPGAAEAAYPNFHQIRTADVDGDGRDEICDGAYVLDDDGSVLYSLAAQGVVHGDRFHISDLDPDRPGLEGFGIQQNNESGLLYYIYDAATGDVFRKHFGAVEDTARGTAADISTADRGFEYWSFHGIHEIKGGSVISPDPRRPWPNFRIWWDGDVLSENLNREIVEKWDPATGGTTRLLTASEDGAVDSWRDAAQFYGDILGDWREEVVLEKSDHSALLIYTTPIPSSTRLYTLAHNPQYRLGFTVKGYLQSLMVDYYLGDGMSAPPPPSIVPVVRAGAGTPVIAGFRDDTGSADNDHITFDNTPTLFGIGPENTSIVLAHAAGGDIGTGTSDATGAWSIALSSPLADGAYTFVARLSGGSTLSSPFGLQVDTTAPSAPLIDAIISDGQGGFLARGTAEPGLAVAVALEGIGEIGRTVAGADGLWSLAYAGTGAGGNWTVTATANDLAGNVSVAAQRVVDRSIATPVIQAVTDDTGSSPTDRVTSDRTLMLSGTAAAGTSVVMYRLDTGVVGSAATDAAGNWSFSSGESLADGSYSFTAYAGASAGAPAFGVTVDGAAPYVRAIEQVAPAAPTSSAETVTFRVSFDEAVAGLDAADFSPVFGGGLTGALASVEAATPTSFDVTLSGLNGEGTVRLDLNATGTGIADLAGNSLDGGFAAGPVFTRVLLGSGVWTRTSSGGLWGANANWEGGIVAGGVGSTADFSRLELPEDNLVRLDSARTLSGLIFGDEDITSEASWLIDDDGTAASVLTLAAGASAPNITVNALGTGATATIAAPLAGEDGFVKGGPGTLILAAENSLTGTINVAAGNLRVATGAVLIPGSVEISNSSAVFTVSGGTVEATGTAEVNGGGDLVVSGGLASFARIAASNNTGNLVLVEGGTLVTDGISFRRSTDGSLNYGTGFVVRGGAAQVGSIELGTSNSNAMMSVEGGLLTATQAIVLGNQSSGGRGGHLRVTGGVFNAPDASPEGGLIVTRRHNNASSVHFLGGESTIERIVLGFEPSVRAGSATVNVDGGSVYLGSGGIVKNGTEAFATQLNFKTGVVGAKANWASAVDVNLPEGGRVVFKAADAADAPFSIQFSGVLSGPGGFTKSGAGTLSLAGDNTFSGGVNVDAGLLAIAGSVGAGAEIVVNAGGSLGGDGEIGRAVVLAEGGTVAPSGAAPDAALSLAALEWNGGGTIAIDLDAESLSERLVIAGALTKGSAGNYTLALNARAPLVLGTQYTVATFDSTTFKPGDLRATGLPSGYGARVIINNTSLRLVIVAQPVITSPLTAEGTYGAPFSYTITSDPAPTSFTAVGLPAGLSLDATTGAIAGVPAAAGVFPVRMGAVNEAGETEKTLTLSIARAAAPVAIDTGPLGSDRPVRRFYTGTPVGVSARTVPAGLDVTFTYDGSASAPTLPGRYDVVATVEDANYEGTANGTLVILTTAWVRHAPVLNGEIDGSVQVLLPESVTLNGGAMISSDLLMPGTPSLRKNGNPIVAGMKDGTGRTDPSAHSVTLNGGTVLRYLVRRIDGTDMPSVAAPRAPSGRRDVVLNRAEQSVGDFATLRHLTLNGSAGLKVIPPGVYGDLVANGASGFVLGNADSAEPAVYELQRLTLNGQAKIQLVGPVVLRLAQGSAATGVVGAPEHPHWLTIELASGGLTLNGGARVYAEVIAPKGQVMINGNARLHGNVIADRLTLNGNALLDEVGEAE